MNGDRLIKQSQDFQAGYAAGHVDGYKVGIKAANTDIAAQMTEFLRNNRQAQFPYFGRKDGKSEARMKALIEE